MTLTIEKLQDLFPAPIECALDDLEKAGFAQGTERTMWSTNCHVTFKPDDDGFTMRLETQLGAVMYLHALDATDVYLDKTAPDEGAAE